MIWMLIAAAQAQPLPDLSQETLVAYSAYERCLVAKSVELEPAGEGVDLTIETAKPQCGDERLMLSSAVMQNFDPRLPKNKLDQGRLAVIKYQNAEFNGRADAVARLAVMKARAIRNGNAPNR